MNTLYTPRLILRPFREDDAPAVYQGWTQDPRVAEYCRWSPHKSLRETEEYIEMCMRMKYSWAITLRGSDVPIGCIDLVGDNSAGVPELGYVLSHDYWNRGIMTEALRAVIAELFRQGFTRLGACHHVDNPASGKVMEKAGMVFTREDKLQRKFGSDELCTVRCYEISREK